jgi:hypothetical protein
MGAQFQQLGERFYHTHHNSIASGLCLDHLFDQPNQIPIMVRGNASTALQTFIIYARILKNIALDPCSYRNETTQKLFAFYPESKNDVFLIPHQSRLYERLKSGTSILHSNNVVKSVSGKDVSKAIKNYLEGVLRHKVLQFTRALEASIMIAEPWSISASLMLIR